MFVFLFWFPIIVDPVRARRLHYFSELLFFFRDSKGYFIWNAPNFVHVADIQNT